jgi:c-di-GMP-binding flagellar brake protein YcgR
MAKSFEERRKYPRSCVVTPVQFVAENKMNNAKIEDISGGGCRIKSSFPIEKDEPIIMQFSIENSNVIVKAIPVWEAHLPEEDSYQVGVMFTDIPENTKSQIVKYVSDHVSV